MSGWVWNFLAAEPLGNQLDQVVYAQAGVEETDQLFGGETGTFSGDGQLIDCRD